MNIEEMQALTAAVVSTVLQHRPENVADGDVVEALLLASQSLVGMATTALVIAKVAPKPAPGY